MIAILVGLTFLPMTAVRAESLSYTLTAGPFATTLEKDGSDRVSMDGFKLRGAPGDPLLPMREYRILLPPDADFSTVKVTIVSGISENIPGAFNIKPASPDSALINGRMVRDWAGVQNIVDGKNMGIYGVNALFPREIIRRAPDAEMRKYRFLRLEFRPVQYNPITKKLIYTSTAVIDIKFERKSEKASGVELEDRVLDEEAPGLFFNYEAAKPWYQAPEKSSGDQPGDMSSYTLVIITTNAIRSGSTEFDAFVASKRESGVSVLVITEDHYDSYSGPERADKIRNWLKANYASYRISYVLLIGDPTAGGTGTAAVPMKNCLPRSTTTPTDMYYSDLSGDWDGDNDGTYGEWADYYRGDPDLYPEVRVGRIPVYNYNYSNLDSILRKIMNYQHTRSSIAWRKTILLPMSFSAAGYDGAPLAEQLWNDYLSGYGFTRYRMYQQGSSSCGANSAYASDWELRGNRVRDRWRYNDYGIVCWWGHGSATSASVGYDGCWDGTLFNTSQCADLDNDHPAVVFQNSCTNGYPESSTNLGYSLLLNGAIGTYSASRVSWFNTGVGYGDFDGSSTNSGIAYEVTRRVANGYWLGNALYWGKRTVISNIATSTRLMNQFDFNLYGDPTVDINDQDDDSTCQTLNDALGNHALSFSDAGNAFWFCQQDYSAPLGGGDAAQSGDITNNESSSFFTQVSGPGVVTFYWSVSSESNYDYLRFYDNNVEKKKISGDVDWQKVSYNVSSGNHTLKWSYTKDGSLYADMDCGWIDYITFSSSTIVNVMPFLYPLLLAN